MKQIVLLTLVFALITSSLLSQKVTREDALKVGLNFYKHNASEFNLTKSSYNVENYTAIISSSKQHEVIHAFNFENGGYVLVSGDRSVVPVLAYSYEGNFDISNIPPAAQMWIDGYMYQIEDAIESKSVSSEEVAQLWEDYYANNFNYSKNNVGVKPLIRTKWDQGEFYNYYCPPVPPNYDPSASASGNYTGRCYTGCVATAMAQVMNYFKYPARGMGSGSFYWGENIVVDYSAEPYNWDKMPVRLTRSLVEQDSSIMFEVARIMYHAGVAVSMRYGPEESGTSLMYAINNPNNPASSQNPFVQNFGYRGGVEYLERSLIPNNEWKHALREELKLKRPVLYSGSSNGAGHAFICDGFQGNDMITHFHFNWGWSGSFDGYYYIDPLPTGSTNPNYLLYPTGQAMINKLAPAGSVGDNFPHCLGEVIIPFTEGRLDDGSGPNTYLDNTNCQWLITMEDIDTTFINFDSLKITFEKFRTLEGDVLSIYDGMDENAPLIGRYEGNNPPPTEISTSGKNLYLSFVTDGSGRADGWELTYSIIQKQIFGVDEYDLTNISVYPNPVNDKLMLKGLKVRNSIKIYDILGKEHFELKNVNEEASINVSHLPAGLYFVKIENAKENRTMKFIKK